MSKVKFLIEKYGITCLSNDNLELFIAEIFNDGYQAGKGKGKDKPDLREDIREDIREGISLRDHFAGLAMQGLLAMHAERYTDYEDDAKDYYLLADAMIAERNKHHKERYETFGRNYEN